MRCNVTNLQPPKRQGFGVSKMLMMANKLFCTMLAGTSIIWGNCANAGLIIEDSKQLTPIVQVMPVPTAQIQTLLVIEHIGEMSSDTKIITTSSKDKPIGKVLSELVPVGWAGYAGDPRIKTIKKVSYVGANRPWPLVLEDVLRDHGLTAKIDWNTKELSIGVSVQGIR